MLAIARAMSQGIKAERMKFFMGKEVERSKIRSTAIILSTVLIILALIRMPSTRAAPTISTFYGDLYGFNVAAGFPAIVVNFDNIAPGTDITNQTIEGIKFEPNLLTPSAPLIVVRGNDTYTPSGFNPAGSGNNTLVATSGENILSPGGEILGPGPNVTLENDDLTLTFTNPVSAVGLDVLFQSLDGYSFTFIKLLDASDNVLYPQTMIPIPAAPNYDGGPMFVGFVSDSSNIAKIVIDDQDSNAQNPDCNIGFDTIRFGPGDTAPPGIELISQNPPRENVQPNQNVTVSVNATDSQSGLRNVTLMYSFDNGTSWETSQTMELNSSSNLFEGTIPGQPANTWVQFSIIAYDNAGNNATLEGTQPNSIYQVVPEFASILILPLFVLATLLTVIAYRRKRTL